MRRRVFGCCGLADVIHRFTPCSVVETTRIPSRCLLGGTGMVVQSVLTARQDSTIPCYTYIQALLLVRHNFYSRPWFVSFFT